MNPIIYYVIKQKESVKIWNLPQSTWPNLSHAPKYQSISWPTNYMNSAWRSFQYIFSSTSSSSNNISPSTASEDHETFQEDR